MVLLVDMLLNCCNETISENNREKLKICILKRIKNERNRCVPCMTYELSNAKEMHILRQMAK